MLAWSKHLNRPYESAWALIQRFRVLNLPSNQELGRLFGRVVPGEDTGRYRQDGRYGDPSDFSLDPLASIFALEPEAVAQLPAECLPVRWMSATFKGIAEVEEAIGRIEVHRHGAFLIFKNFQTWYFHAPWAPSS